jgi:hypothetical protein
MLPLGNFRKRSLGANVYIIERKRKPESIRAGERTYMDNDCYRLNRNGSSSRLTAFTVAAKVCYIGMSEAVRPVGSRFSVNFIETRAES